MYKLAKRAILIAMIFYAIGMNSCTKDSLVINDDNDGMTAIQKWHPEESFVLPDIMCPYQYAIHKDGLTRLFDYMQSVLKSNQTEEKNGCFILSFNIEKALYYYGFITETSIHYDPYNPNIWIVPIGGGGSMCFAVVDSKTFDNFKEAQKWATEKMDKGYTTCINYDKKTNTYLVTVNDNK
ncbi:MAG: hypothetical protein LBG80_08380 [Bacteroidales bacterium]|nr:hypothetical protein [Bacteroidales bacterium]